MNRGASLVPLDRTSERARCMPSRSFFRFALFASVAEASSNIDLGFHWRRRHGIPEAFRWRFRLFRNPGNTDKYVLWQLQTGPCVPDAIAQFNLEYCSRYRDASGTRLDFHTDSFYTTPELFRKVQWSWQPRKPVALWQSCFSLSAPPRPDSQQSARTYNHRAPAEQGPHGGPSAYC